MFAVKHKYSIQGNMQLYEVLVEFEKLLKNKGYFSWKARSGFGLLLGYNFRGEL